MPFAQASGPIVIGHHCDLTGVISSWGVWHDKAAKAAVDIINQGRRHRRPQGRAGDRGHRIQSGARRPQAAQPDSAHQRRVRRRLGAFRRDARGDPDRLRAQDASISRPAKRPKRPARRARAISFRTGTDTYSIAAASMPWCVQNFGKVWTIIYADYAWGQSTDQESKAVHRARRRQGAQEHRCAARHQGLRALSGADFRPTPKCCCRPSSARCRSPSTPRPRPWASTRR